MNSNVHYKPVDVNRLSKFDLKEKFYIDKSTLYDWIFNYETRKSDRLELNRYTSNKIPIIFDEIEDKLLTFSHGTARLET